MDKLRILPVVFVCGLFSTPSFAQLTTIGPNTPGVSEFDVTLVQTNPACTSNTSDCNFVPHFTSIQPLQPGGGGLDFGAMALHGNGCFQGCPLPTAFPTDPSEVEGIFTMFDVSFHTAKPVTTVVALQMPFSAPIPDDGAASPVEMLAFDGQQLVSMCVVSSAVPGCYRDATVIGFTDGFPSVFVGNLTVSAPKITSVWIGSVDIFIPSGAAPLSAKGVEFGVPEPGTLALFALALAGLALTRKRCT